MTAPSHTPDIRPPAVPPMSAVEIGAALEALRLSYVGQGDLLRDDRFEGDYFRTLAHYLDQAARTPHQDGEMRKTFERTLATRGTNPPDGAVWGLLDILKSPDAGLRDWARSLIWSVRPDDIWTLNLFTRMATEPCLYQQAEWTVQLRAQAATMSEGLPAIARHLPPSLLPGFLQDGWDRWAPKRAVSVLGVLAAERPEMLTEDLLTLWAQHPDARVRVAAIGAMAGATRPHSPTPTPTPD